jgi:hypothetical protein
MDVIYRIRYSDLAIVESINGKNWRKSKMKFCDAIFVVKLFKAHGNLGALIDLKNSKFLKGAFSTKPLGSRINILPDGQELKGTYSLFSPHLMIHDEMSNSHWDVIYQNPNGEFSYIYTKEKKRLSRLEKFRRVEEFNKIVLKLKRNLLEKLEIDSMALPMLILLKTNMRVGNEIYYLKTKHKGLTTLKYEDVRISGSKIIFDYVGKDGIPQKKEKIFSKKIIDSLKKLIKKKKRGDFLFSGINGHPLKDVAFEVSFKKYSGKQFYPHIVRSAYATKRVQKFLKNKRKVAKSEVEKLYISIADELGHKKFSKKNEQWEISYQSTINHYIQPELVAKVSKITI